MTHYFHNGLRQSVKNKQKEHSSIFQVCTELLGNLAVSVVYSAEIVSCFQSDMPKIEYFSQTYVFEISGEIVCKQYLICIHSSSMKDKLILGIRIKELLFLVPRKKEVFVFVGGAFFFFKQNFSSIYSGA